MKILVFGNGNAGINVIQGICFGCTKTDIWITYVYKYGYASNIAGIRMIQFVDDEMNELEIASGENADLIISAGWHRKFPVELTSTQDCFNIHPSLLPKYRGILPMEFQLFNKERNGGVTIHKMNERFDAGPIYLQKSFNIEGISNVSELVVLVSRITRKMIVEFINDFDLINAVPQDEAEATYYSKRDMYLLEGNERS